MPDTNDYLSQLLARVDRKLSESEGAKEDPGADAQAPSEPSKQVVFTTGGRFDDVPFSEQPAEQKSAADDAHPEEHAPVYNMQPHTRGEAYDAEEDTEDDHPKEVPGDLEETVKKTFTFSSDRKTADQPEDDPGDGPEDVLDWNVSEDVEKYLSSGDGSTIFDKMTASSEKKSGRARRAEKRMLKENTRQLMDRNSGAKRGCFGAFFHVILVALLVAFTILAVLYVLQTIADVTIIDINSVISYVSDFIAGFIDSFKK